MAGPPAYGTKVPFRAREASRTIQLTLLPQAATMRLPTRFAAAVLAGLALASLPLHAQQPVPASAPGTRFELTAIAGIQSGADFSDQQNGGDVRMHSAENLGLILDFNVAPDTQLEILYSRATPELDDSDGSRLADLKIEHLHVGGVYVYNAGHVRPFFAATLGATRFDPSAPGSGSDTRFSLGLGGGVKLMLTDNIGVRLEARAYAIEVDSDSAVFCVNNTCRIHYDGDFLMQYAAHAGVVIAF